MKPMRWLSRLLVVMCVALASLSDAHAFCRTTTKEPEASPCPSECTTVGAPLAWSVRVVDVHLNEDGFAAWRDDDVRSVVQSAFDAWTSVSCEGEPMGMTVNVVPETTTYEVGPGCEPGVRVAPDGQKCEPNDNSLVYYDRDEWHARGLASLAYALTAVWFVETTGEILGADIQFNGGMGRLTECEVDICAPGQNDLLNVVTHETGHFFGLSHSNVPGTTMWCDANAGETMKRSVEEDDVEGICSIYGPDAEFKKAQALSKPTSRGCGVMTGEAPSERLPLALFALGMALGVARRGSSRRIRHG